MFGEGEAGAAIGFRAYSPQNAGRHEVFADGREEVA